jgi:alpha-galactosidase
VTVKWTDLGLVGTKAVRDLWRQKDLGQFQDEFKSTVPRHGVILLRITKP